MKIRNTLLAVLALCMMLPDMAYAQESCGLKKNSAAASINIAQTAVWASVQTGVGGKINACAAYPAQTLASYTENTPGYQQYSGTAMQIVRMVNEERARYGLRPLNVSTQLTNAAFIRAKEIVGKFSHTRPDGSSWSTVSAAAKGENIARGHKSAERVMAAWMTSEGHRKNILRDSFGSIGVCALNVNGVMYWVQLFGR